jgi:hypothetical protein
VVAALRKLLRPLVRFAIRQGLTYPALADLLKGLYVEVAARDLSTGPAPSQSRISVATGVHRKDVRRLLDKEADPAEGAATASLGARIVGIWVGTARYLDRTGRPKPLPRQAAADEPSFDELVAAVSKDIRPRAVLDEWLRLGVVALDGDNRVALNVNAFVPQAGYDEKAYFFGRNVRDHIATATHNLLGDGEPFLERAVFYDRLTAESAAALARRARQLGDEALLAVNREALAKAEADETDPSARHRVTFGIYFYAAESASTLGKGGQDDDA